MSHSTPQVYYAFEETDMCMRLCCGSAREFTIHVVDNFNRVLRCADLPRSLQYETVFVNAGSDQSLSPVQVLRRVLLVRWLV